MNLMLLLFIILFKSSFERNLAIDSPLSNYENKKYPTYKNSLFKANLKVDGFFGNGLVKFIKLMVIVYIWINWNLIKIQMR